MKNMETNTANMKALKELVLDEHKIVTYVSLSKELCIHVNDAKSLLCELIKNIRKTQPEIDLSVSYVVSGLLNNSSGCHSVCSEKDLDALKKTFKIIFYEHVYCVSRGSKDVDNVALTGINKFEDLPLCTGLIKAISCSKRTDNEIGNLKSKNHAALNVPKTSSVEQKPKDKIKEVQKQENGKSVPESKLAPNVKSEPPSPKKEVSNNHKTPTKKANNNKTVGKGIAGFFNKVNGDSTKTKKTAVKVEEQEIKVEKDNKEKPEIKVEKDIKVEPMSVDTDTPPVVAKASSKTVKAKGNKNKATVDIKKNAKVDKKRKRLLHVSDSESDAEENDPFKTNEMEVEHESEDEIPPTPTINTVKITSGIVNPKKRRKIVDKTYTDEDGYILTKKEEVYESCSENEEEEKVNNKQIKENGKHEQGHGKPEKDHDTNTKENIEQIKLVTNEKSPKKTKSKKISPPKKGKQPTLNNFFKKI
ncbi:hypothetical protein PYW07_016552 [Mythimna separata]|uniref:DNA polymerase delta subunit 3 n=1 Tax=Mythimna separata TaxID=271217 RepID=A0AAD8DRN8_MYTSE|nr:hypothetical protein PYW07_016552 [Mythimna separata]